MTHARLAATQRRLWRLIAWPEGVAAALRDEAAGTPPLDSVVRSDERLAAVHRLDVYANAYFFRIHDVLAEDYPTLRAALDETGFHDLVTSYLAVHPSTHPSLRWIGGRLPDFLREHAAAAGVRARCPQAADLADLEWAIETVFDAPDSAFATYEALAALPAGAWDALPLRLRPSVRLLRLAWPVHELRAAHANERPLPEVAPRDTPLCVWRQDEQVRTRELEANEAHALSFVTSGAASDVLAAPGVAFGALCEALALRHGEAEAPALAAGWLARWTADGLVLAID